jgi:serine/threonine protein kinase
MLISPLKSDKVLDNKTDECIFKGKRINKYIIQRYINSGAFGNVYEAVHKDTGIKYALKLPIISKDKNGVKMLMDEARIYKKLSNPSKGIANVKIIKYTDDSSDILKDKDKNKNEGSIKQEDGKINTKIIVMDLLGSSLESLFQKNNKKFSLQTVIRLAISFIDIIQYIHSNGYIHRDLKPDNFTIGYTDKDKLFCIDFGLAKKYLNRKGEHIKFNKNKRFCGTATYASIAAHENVEQSRKDDLESIAYILIYLYKGKLPWKSIKHKDKKKRYELIYKEKIKYTPEELCKGMPKQFIVFLDYIRTMDFDEKPPYSSFKKMFMRLYNTLEYKDELYDWEK